MTTEEKELLLKDLCARLPYGVKLSYDGEYGKEKYPFPLNDINRVMINNSYEVEGIKPYLRPMSSMTEGEEKEFQEIKLSYHFDEDSYILFDWLNARHFDYRNLIDKGLALDCTNLNIYQYGRMERYIWI